MQEDLQVSSDRGAGEGSRGAAHNSTASSDPGSPRSISGADSARATTGRGALVEASAEGVEAHILARIAAICQPGMYLKARQSQVISCLAFQRS